MTQPEETKERIVIIKETTLSSITQDIVTFTMMCLAFWFNYTYIGGNDALDALLFITFFIMGFSHIKNYKRLEEITKPKRRREEPM